MLVDPLLLLTACCVVHCYGETRAIDFKSEQLNSNRDNVITCLCHTQQQLKPYVISLQVLSFKVPIYFSIAVYS